MSESIRIRTSIDGSDKQLRVKINQDFDFIEILSLKITQDEVYRRFSSDYGCIVGRVSVNNGFGVPNAKVSIFIPVANEDKEDPEIYGLYPYEQTGDKNREGYRYNLLPKTNETLDECFTPIGSMFTKREVQDNADAEIIYRKYYKFTTTTNKSGDFMLFGVPVGEHFLHVDADISDIGILSQNPYDLIREGESERKFESASKFKSNTNLDTLPQLKTRSPISVTVLPFWGDTEEFEIGISRTDIDLAQNITPTAIFMGSIFGDDEKHAISKRCRPRRKLGKMGEMTTGAGLIEMIRKTPTGSIERYDVEGGAVIDDDGVWAYQIPMNLDYVVTDEFGNLVPTDDPTKGLPTRSRVRFRIGMFQTGTSGRKQIRAKYLVPHDPETWSDTDYTFNEKTKDTHFTDLYWNKIYTVANHITRFQNRCGRLRCHETRNFIGIKETDEGGNNPFPYNKMDTQGNPLFTVLCVILTIIALLMRFINRFLIRFINILVFILNKVLLLPLCGLIYGIGFGLCAIPPLFFRYRKCREKFCIGKKNDGGKKCNCSAIIPYAPYVTVGCGADTEGERKYCIGCKVPPEGGRVVEETWDATLKRINEDADVDDDASWGDGEFVQTDNQHLIPFYPEEGTPRQWDKTFPKGDAGWRNCVALGLADSLDVFRFDFYNNWINGTLYAFLLKYKIRENAIIGANVGEERFCEQDCDDEVLGADNNNNGNPDNRCYSNHIVDTCTGAVPQNQSEGRRTDGVESYMSLSTKEGVIKKDKESGELYYAAYSRYLNAKLYATKVVSLGAVDDCDWQGQIKIHPYLVNTTYLKPPLVFVEHDDSSLLSGIVESGFDGPDRDPEKAQLIEIRCFNFVTGSQQCNNLRRICEYGMTSDIDTRSENGIGEIGGEIIYSGSAVAANQRVGNEEVDNVWVRGAFVKANSPYTEVLAPVKIDSATSNVVYQENEEPPSYNNPRPVDAFANYKDPIYSAFTGIRINNLNDSNESINRVWQYDNSFYFYFGLLQGKTALEKLNSKYFPPCEIPVRSEFSIIISGVTDDGSNNDFGTGTISFFVEGGVGPYTYTWTGPFGYECISEGPDIAACGNPDGSLSILTGLSGGTYNVTVTDSNGNIATNTVFVGGLDAVTCGVVPSLSSGGNDYVEVYFDGGSGVYDIEIVGENVSNTATNISVSPICFGDCPEQPENTQDNVYGAIIPLPDGGLIGGETYTVTVTDPVGIEDNNADGTTELIFTECQETFTVQQALTLSVTLEAIVEYEGLEEDEQLPCANSVGSARAIIVGGVAPYEIVWYINATDEFLTSGITASSLQADVEYKAVVTDFLGNQAAATITLNSSSNGLNFTLDVAPYSHVDGYGVIRISEIEGQPIVGGSNDGFLILDNEIQIDPTIETIVFDEEASGEVTVTLENDICFKSETITVPLTDDSDGLFASVEEFIGFDVIEDNGSNSDNVYGYIVKISYDGGWNNKHFKIVPFLNGEGGSSNYVNNNPNVEFYENYTDDWTAIGNSGTIEVKVKVTNVDIPGNPQATIQEPVDVGDWNFAIWITDRNQGSNGSTFEGSTFGAVKLGFERTNPINGFYQENLSPEGDSYGVYGYFNWDVDTNQFGTGFPYQAFNPSNDYQVPLGREIWPNE